MGLLGFLAPIAAAIAASAGTDAISRATTKKKNEPLLKQIDTHPRSLGPTPGIPADIRGRVQGDMPKALPVGDGGGGFNIGQVIAQMAPQLLSTGIGLGFPGALPGAAGFSRGFTEEQLRQKKLGETAAAEETEFERDVKLERIKAGIKDLPSSFDIEKEARQRVNAMINENPAIQMELIQNPTRQVELIDAEVERLKQKFGVSNDNLGAQALVDEMSGEPEPSPSGAVDSDMVTIETPSGKRRTMSRTEAIQRGYISGATK